MFYDLFDTTGSMSPFVKGMKELARLISTELDIKALEIALDSDNKQRLAELQLAYPWKSYPALLRLLFKD